MLQEEIKNVVAYGVHASAHKKKIFFRSKLLIQMRLEHIVVILSEVKDLPNLNLSPIKPIAYKGRRHHLIY